MIHGLIPGPLLFEQSPQFVYSVFWAYLVANLANLIVTFSTIKLWVKVLKIPQPVLLPVIFILCIVGTYALRNTFFDTGVMFCFGLLAYFMIKYQFPIIPLLLAIILGPNLEEHLRMSLIISQGDYSIFITHPICLAFIIVSIFSFFGPLVWPLLKNRKRPAVTDN
jgi:putative tricarboxylic transport membrane protein